MKSLLFPIFSVLLTPAGLLAALAGPEVELANLDARPQVRAAPQSLTGERLDSATELKRRIPGVNIDLDPVTAAPSWIRSSVGFLTGPLGEDEALPKPPGAAAARVEEADPHRGIKTFLDENKALFGHDSTILNAARISREFVTDHNGMRTVAWEQSLDGIPIFEAILVGHLTRNGELVSIGSRFIPDASRAGDAGLPNRQFAQAFPLVSPQQAIACAATNIGEILEAGEVEAVEATPEGTGKRQNFRAPPLLNETRAELMWLPMDRSTMRLCWRVILTGRARKETFQVLVDSETVQVQIRHSWTFRAQTATYRVFGSDSPSPFSPGWATPNTNQPAFVQQTNITLTAISTNASPNGWVNTNPAVSIQTNTTFGNNVAAHLDVDGDNIPDLPRPQGVLNTTNGVLEFLFSLDLTKGLCKN